MTVAVAVRGGAPNAVNVAGISTVFPTRFSSFLGGRLHRRCPRARRRLQADCRGVFSVGAGQDAPDKPRWFRVDDP
jgi:hypothetical protein